METLVLDVLEDVLLEILELTDVDEVVVVGVDTLELDEVEVELLTLELDEVEVELLTLELNDVEVELLTLEYVE